MMDVWERYERLVVEKARMDGHYAAQLETAGRIATALIDGDSVTIPIDDWKATAGWTVSLDYDEAGDVVVTKRRLDDE